jgi:hypothetical protein
MSETLTGSKDSTPRRNFAVPVGAVIVIVCFFLPWITLDHSSAMEVSGDPLKAESAFVYLRLYADHPLSYTRLLYLIPTLALSTLLLDSTVPPGHVGRVAARLGAFAGGATLCFFFIFCGLRMGPKLTYGFWGSLSGALYISVGALFDVFRNE